ncbi:MAG: CDP-glycerol glycerophosphotransferase family protein [Salinivirgaceae bacterium]|nr:CDP-glycerol glycerophosphotransferase family protein [Salinivirgaceae bacterium]
MKSKLEYILKHNLLIQQIYKITLSLFFRFVGLFIRTDEKLILLNSFGGRKYNDSPKVIFEYMSNHVLYKDLTYVWAFESPQDFDILNAKKIKIDSWTYFITALKAKYWISSVNIERGLKFKKKNTIYLNTWHGAGTKKIGNAVAGRKDFDFSNVNIMLVQSVYEKKIFRKDFLVQNNDFLLSGFPRSDELFYTDKDQIEQYKKELNIPSNKKILLYAPTWRDSINGGQSYDIKPPININKWQNQLGDEYIVLFRTHAFTTKVLNMKFNDFVRDASSYENLNHLLKIADIVITDYSTLVFDYSILEKPFLCFGYDYCRYKEERGFYLDIEKEYPSGVLKTEDEVLKYIMEMDYEHEVEKVRKFKMKFIEAGGKATELSVKRMFNIS